MASDINIASLCFSNALFKFNYIKLAIFCAVCDTYIFWNIEDGISIHEAKFHSTELLQWNLLFT